MVRGEFTEAAVQAKAGKMGAADEAVGPAMNACVACHEGYR
jgi:cytochrome c553